MNGALRLTEAAVEFLWWGGRFAKSFSCRPNNCVEVVLRSAVVGVVTIFQVLLLYNSKNVQYHANGLRIKVL